MSTAASHHKSSTLVELANAFQGIIGLVLGISVMVVYAIITLGRFDFPWLTGSLFAFSLLSGLVGLRLQTGRWRDNHYEIDDEGPGPFAQCLAWATVPVWFGTLLFVVVGWF